MLDNEPIPRFARRGLLPFLMSLERPKVDEDRMGDASQSIREVLEPLMESDGIRRAVLSRPAGNVEFDRIDVRRIILRDAAAFQFTERQNGRQTHRNLSPAETTEQLVRLAAESFRNLHVFTADDEITLRRRGSRVKVARKRRDVDAPAASPQQHDRTRKYLIPDGTRCPFLIETGIMATDGRVRKKSYHKFRQINRFLELVNDIVPSLPAEGTLRILDLGCGKSYLTFAVHHLLTVIHGRDVEIKGIDVRSDVIESSQKIADHLNMTGISFQIGTIGDLNSIPQPHLVISLHACDTATDDVLRQSVNWQVPVILAVPCCQHEIADGMSRDAIAAIGRHGILHDRLAAIITDAWRAEWLEQHGYRTQVVEFIDLEHTAKNVLIRAVRRSDGGLKNGTSDVPDRSAALQQLTGLEGFALTTE